MSRCARERRVFFFEEPVYIKDQMAQVDISARGDNLYVVQPLLPKGISEAEAERSQQAIINELIAQRQIKDYLLWYYTPMALAFSSHLRPQAIVFDCMDELSAFANAPAALKYYEAELLRRADIVFTGGYSLYQAKRERHPNVHAFPSSVDVPHFAQARTLTVEPPDQSPIAGPRLGFFGVIDERMDLELVAGVAAARPDWHLLMIGPVVKIDPATLPRGPNIHYLGPKPYEALPQYIAGWDVALLPFARNDATRFISPTKTPEYMAAGKPVVSTSIRDVVRPYGEQGLIRIADTVAAFVEAVDAALAEDATVRLRQTEAFLRQTSWDGTWARMRHLLDAALLRPMAPARAAGGA
jgi:glycosyltransferase involved in cell wall biosynthesis